MTERDEPDDGLDETLEETFPASDAPANTVETGVHIAQEAEPEAQPVIDNVQAQRFEVTVDGAVGFLQYERRPGSLVLVHTEVPPALRGRGLGDLLADTAIARARAEGLQLVVVCPFVRAYLRKHPEKLAKT